jgi:hypothetical protein
MRVEDDEGDCAEAVAEPQRGGSTGHEARMHQIEGACRQLGVIGVAHHKLNVVLAARPHALARMLEEDGIRIKGRRVGRADPLCLRGRIPDRGSAIPVRHRSAPADSVRCERGALDMQPLDLASGAVHPDQLGARRCGPLMLVEVVCWLPQIAASWLRRQDRPAGPEGHQLGPSPREPPT